MTSPLNNSFCPLKYAWNVLVSRDLPKRRGRERKTYFLVLANSYTYCVLSTYKYCSSLMLEKVWMPMGYFVIVTVE